MQITQALLKMQKSIKKDNQMMNIKAVARFSPYEIVSEVTIGYLRKTNYQELLLLDSHEKDIIEELKEAGFGKERDVIFMFSGIIHPEQIDWIFWRHPEEIKSFIRGLNNDMRSFENRQNKWEQQGEEIIRLYEDLNKVQTWSQDLIIHLVSFLNLSMKNSFLKKTTDILTFVNHCLPINLWNLTVYQQGYICKQNYEIDKKMHSPGSDLDYITVTHDGIIRSKRNLLQSRIQKMLPYTNQLKVRLSLYNKRNLVLKVKSFENQSFEANFKDQYIKALNIYLGIKTAIRNSELFNMDKNRFESFSKKRNNCWARLYNDGQGYFNDLCEALNNARNQVLITDWWLTPYFLLKRPGNINEKQCRLDGIFKRIADRGVKIFIILFREPLNMLCNDSEQTQLYLESLSRNIKVRRHPIIPQIWSHHEKCCIIDQVYGFMGGLDICYGRWDTPAHSIIDKQNKWNGGDYTNQRLRPFTPGTTHNFTQSPINRQKEPRMPWHDIAIQIQGDAVIDLTRHFIQYWNYVTIEKGHDCADMKRLLTKRYNRAFTYQDVQQNWEEGKQEISHQKTCGDKVKNTTKGIKAFFKGTQRRLPQLLIQVREGYKSGHLQLQLCRSASEWSIGAKKTEQSIHLAYQSLIEESENFIYIENQFFMGKKNKIVECLANRIRKAHLEKQNFKVIVVMPLLPGFDGNISDSKSVSLRVQVHNQFQAINRGEKSLYSYLSDLQNFQIKHYIYFFGLRGHAVLDNKPVTEIIYIHSKLMIVDDKRAIIGSANINDRSLLGSRDSQLAVVIEQNNGQISGQCKGTIFELRCRLFDEHFNLTSQETSDINSPLIWAKIIANAKNNTLIYRTVFGCYPDDNITVSTEVSQKQSQSSPQLYDDLKQSIFGHAVEFPLNFMLDQDLQAKKGDKEAMLGEQLFL